MKPRQIVFRTPRQARDVADAILFIGAEPGTTALDTGPKYEAQAGTIPSGMSFGDQGYVLTDAPMPIVQQIARRLGAEIVPQRHPRTITNRHRPNPPNGLKVGDRFEHKHFLNPETRQPLVGLVTRIAGGIVYYRPDYGLHDDGTPWLGSAAYFPVEQQSRWVARIISHRTKRNPMSRKSGLTRAKAREMLDEHDYVSERQRRFLGARASGEPRRNAPGEVTIFDRENNVIGRSKNLRGILNRSRKHVVTRITLGHMGGSQGQLGITWRDGSFALADFADYEVMRRFVTARRTRLFALADVRDELGEPMSNPRSAGSWGVWVVTDGYDNVAVVVAEGEAKARAELREYSKLGRVSLIPIVEGLSKAKAVEAGKRTAARVLGSGYEPHISPRN